MPRLYVPASAIPCLGEVTLGRRVGVGEASLEVPLDVREGLWRAFYLDEEALDRLVDEGVLAAPEEADRATQLLLVHAQHELPTEGEVANLRQVARVSIEGARFTLADQTLASALSGASGFDDHLDGVHGPLRNGKGVTIMLDGDGHAIVWADPSDGARIVLVEIW